MVAAAEDLLLSRNHSLLVQYGENLRLDKPWAKSLLIWMGFVKRKATNAGKIPPAEFVLLKSDSLHRYYKSVHIPPQLVLNLDDTAINHVPATKLDYGVGREATGFLW